MFYIIMSLAVAGLLVGIASRCNKSNDVSTGSEDETKSCVVCGGVSSCCGNGCILEAASGETEYYDDEELDMFKGREPFSYSDDEVDQFRYVLYTMQREEVAGWCRSLDLRGINMPDKIKDEVIMLING